ncbi:hypothetical protein PG993_006880 [Apiospora rasikravindrae]|uniref:Zn(2)-C6 fungal-type domain-containing protein n=1 Tax=Apiospora rasikravindrae TaxID=990691 RepID=A0ABR1SVW4_9PEZI
MPPAVDNSTLSPPAQSRRLACDRCHQHRLKCERDDVGSINGAAESWPPACKRCRKAQVLCQISSNNSGNSSNTDNNNKRGAKRKGVHAEDGEPHERTISADKVLPTAFPNDFAASPDPVTSFGPGGPSVPSTDEASLFNFGGFDFGTGDFTGGWVPPVSPTSALVGTAAPRMQSVAGEDGKLAPPNSVLHSYVEGLDLALFGDNPTPLQSNESNNTSSDQSLFSSQTPARSTALTAEPDSSFSADAVHDDCRRRLQSLHATIFGELHHLSGTDLEHLLSGSYATTSLVHSRSGGGCDDNGSSVHKLHVATESLIELMLDLDIACADTNRGHKPATHASSTPECSACDTSPSGLHHQHSATYTPLSHLTFVGSHRNSGTFSSSAMPPPPTSSSAVDLPIIASFLTCYVGLMVIYRNVLTHALHSLRSTEQHRHIRTRQGSIASTIAGSSSGKSSSGGAATAARHSYHGSSSSSSSSSSNGVQQALRMRIQTEMLSHLIERVEDAWDSVKSDEHEEPGRGEDSHSYPHHRQQPHNRHGSGMRRHQETTSKVLFRRAGTAELLRQMLAYEGFQASEEEGVESRTAVYHGVAQSDAKVAQRR